MPAFYFYFVDDVANARTIGKHTNARSRVWAHKVLSLVL